MLSWLFGSMFSWLFERTPQYKVMPCILYDGTLGYGIGELFYKNYILSPSLSMRFRTKEEAQKAVNHLLIIDSTPLEQMIEPFIKSTVKVEPKHVRKVVRYMAVRLQGGDKSKVAMYDREKDCINKMLHADLRVKITISEDGSADKIERV